MGINKVIDRFIAEYNKALGFKEIHKPIAFALYQTWLWVDKNEKPRKE